MNIKDMLMVGMADLKAASNPGVLTTLGLGSCVGIALYDAHAKVAGLAHCMLPDSTQIQNNGNIAKFVDTAVIRLINDMTRLGARKEFLKAKIAGGAQMFAFNTTNESMRIGDRNVAAATKLLSELRIPIIGKDTGSDYGRTVELYAEDGRFLIKTIGHGIKTI
ncbi:MAG: chemotaxis protein CheD [Clostridiales bacterium]|jgi:chemotaxis protein CheD|nr:chemotaxis protein CheD [Clostridiales bacterium]